MKKIFLTLLAFSIINPLISQDFSPEFLQSLPEDARAELLQSTDKRLADEATQYRRPSTFIKKPREDSDRFGTNYFSMMQSTLMPLNEPNFDPSYILDFGDVIQLQLVGQKNQILEIPILRDGSVNLPDIGKIFLSGMSLEEATKIIKDTYSASFIGVEAFVTLVNIRDIQVMLAGDVYNPGPYILNGNSNLYHALTVSGGPSDLGSYREIYLIRDNKKIQTLDLYEIFIFAEGDFGMRLRSGDTIFVNPSNALVSITGAVKRPGIYELKADETVKDLIRFANGFSPLVDKESIFIERINNEGIIKNIKISENNLDNVFLSDGQSIFVRSFPIREVKISGAVANPGAYKLNEGDGILELINRAGGYNPNAYEFGGILLNLDAKNISSLSRKKLYDSVLKSTTDNAIAGVDYDSILMLMDELYKSESNGRVSAEFDIKKIAENPSLNKLLMDGDEVIIPELVDHIYIYGEISNQGTVRYQKGYTSFDYIESQGGFTELADRSSIFILHANGTSQRLKRKNVFRDGLNDIEIYPGSIIFIPRKMPNRFRAESLQAYASILGDLGVSLASISVLKD
tara:strand:+ start:23995 stop:25713 length:1719 start_codon:yes stop_codon:yes gene_type:complete